MRISRTLLGSSVFAALTLVSTAAHAQNYLYTGDYSGQQVLRFNGDTGAVTPSGAPYVSGYGGEGIGGVGNTLSVAGSDGYVHFYDVSPAGAPIALGTLKTQSNGLRINYNSAGTVMYVAENDVIQAFNYNKTNPSASTLLRTINVANVTGKSSGSWGIAVNPLDQSVYFTTGWNGGSSAGIYKATSDLSSVTTLVAPGSNGNTALVGITFTSTGDFYAINGGNADPNNSFIDHYTSAGVLKNKVNLAGVPTGALNNAFDTEIGPDGNLYVSSQAGACVLEFNTSNDTFNRVLVAAHAGGLVQAKTLHFYQNNIGVATPEPSEFTFAGIFAAGVAGMIVLKKRNAKRSA